MSREVPMTEKVRWRALRSEREPWARALPRPRQVKQPGPRRRIGLARASSPPPGRSVSAGGEYDSRGTTDWSAEGYYGGLGVDPRSGLGGGAKPNTRRPLVTLAMYSCQMGAARSPPNPLRPCTSSMGISALG